MDGQRDRARAWFVYEEGKEATKRKEIVRVQARGVEQKKTRQ